MAMPTSLSSSSSANQWTYDVFLCFRGMDTRSNFTGHLYYALSRNQINAFMDDKSLRKGDEITPALTKAIKESRIAIVIFSKNFASSRFCLDEIVMIMDCLKRKGNYQVLPVFYKVTPAVVRHQIGSFEESLANHERRISGNGKVQEWKAALEEAANIFGWHVDGQQEYKIIQDIVNDVSKMIHHSTSCVANNSVSSGSFEQKSKAISPIMHGTSGQPSELQTSPSTSSFRAQSSSGLGSIDQSSSRLGSIAQSSLGLAYGAQSSLGLGTITQSSPRLGTTTQSSPGLGYGAQSSSGLGSIDQSSSRLGSIAQSSLGLGTITQSSPRLGTITQSSPGLGYGAQSSSGLGSIAQSSLGLDYGAQSSSRVGIITQSSSGLSTITQPSSGLGSIAQSSSGLGTITQSSSGLGFGPQSSSPIIHGTSSSSAYGFQAESSPSVMHGTYVQLSGFQTPPSGFGFRAQSSSSLGYRDLTIKTQTTMTLP